MSLPVPVNGAKAKGKILEKAVSETGVTLKYEGGGQIDMIVADGSLVLRPSALPADTANLFFSMRLDTTVLAGGKWQFDSKAGDFPASATGGQIYQGGAKNVTMSLASGKGLTLALPSSSFQQLMDLRQFGGKKEFFWQCWMPVAAGAETMSIKVSDNSGTPASAVAAPASAPSTANAPASAPASQAPASTSAPASAAVTPAPKTEASKTPAPPIDRQKFGQVGSFSESKTGTRILKWKDGKKAVYMLGFDDNYPTMFTNVIPELEKRKMVGNFYVNPGSPNWTKHKDDWATAAKSPYVVLHNHTFLHTGIQSVDEFEQDLKKTNDAIYAITPQFKNPRLIVFRQPGGCIWKITKDETKASVAKYHMASRPWLDGPPLTMKTLEEMLATVDTALSRGEVGFVDFHGVGGNQGLTVPTERFTALLDKLEAQRENFWITDAVSLHQYQGERKSSTIKVLQSDASEVRVSLTCTLDPVYFDLPLTVAVEVPASWKECNITQGSKTSQAVAAGGEVRFDALPGPDEIVIKPQ